MTLQNKTTEQNKKDRWIELATLGVFIIALIAYSLLMLTLFYRQAVSNDVTFKSDMAAYLLEMQGIDSGYDFPYPIFFWMGRFFMLFTNVPMAAALATMVLNSLSVVILAYYIQKTLQESYRTSKYEKYFGLLTIAAAFSIFFISMLFAPKGVYLPGMDHKYLGVFTPNPFHNATYMATRPFSIVAFFLFVRILAYYEERTDWKEFITFGIFMLLTTMTKPSFTLVMVSAAGLVMAYRIIRSGFKTLIPGLKLGLCFVPTFLDLLYQFGGVFGGRGHAGEEGGIGFGWASVWSVHIHNIPLAIILALAFPGLMLLLNLKQLKKNTLYRFSWQLLIVSLLELLILYEKGDRFVHMNFAWGYMHGIFFVFVTSLILLIQNTVTRRQKWYLLVPQWLAYGWHLFCGIVYFQYIWSGQFYYSF